jgi:hypothetical protein
MRDTVGHAASVLIEAEPMTRFAVDWLENRFTLPSASAFSGRHG